jgi:hypothetical protein
MAQEKQDRYRSMGFDPPDEQKTRITFEGMPFIVKMYGSKLTQGVLLKATSKNILYSNIYGGPESTQLIGIKIQLKDRVDEADENSFLDRFEQHMNLKSDQRKKVGSPGVMLNYASYRFDDTIDSKTISDIVDKCLDFINQNPPHNVPSKSLSQ